MDDKWLNKYKLFINFHPIKEITKSNAFISKHQTSFLTGDTINATLCVQLCDIKSEKHNLQDPLQFCDEIEVHKLVVQFAIIEQIQGQCSLSSNDEEKYEHRCHPVAYSNDKWRKKTCNWTRRDNDLWLHPICVSLGTLSPNMTSSTSSNLDAQTSSCKIQVTLWSPWLVDIDTSSKKSNERHDQIILKQMASEAIDIVAPPAVYCRHYSVAGKHYCAVRLQNIYPEPVFFNEVQLVQQNDSTKHSVDKARFPVDIKCMKPYTGTLQSDESHSILFEFMLNSNGSMLDVSSLFAVVGWNKVSSDQTITRYTFPGLHFQYPHLVITSVPSHPKVEVDEKITVTYTVFNKIHDFQSLKFQWVPGKALLDPNISETKREQIQNVVQSVVCHQPYSDLGRCTIGSTVTAVVDFHFKHPGVYELGQHMKVNLQYSIVTPDPASIANNSMTTRRKDSITSTHSMPSSDLQKPMSNPTKSRSMTPIATSDAQLSPSHAKQLTDAGNEGRRLPPSYATGRISSNQVLKRNCLVYVC